MLISKKPSQEPIFECQSLLTCLSVNNRIPCLADFLSCSSKRKRYLLDHFSCSHVNSRRRQRTKPMSRRSSRHVTWPKSSVMLFLDCGEVRDSIFTMLLYYFEQLTRHSIRAIFSLMQRKNIFTVFTIVNRIFDRKTVGLPLRCKTHNCNEDEGLCPKRLFNFLMFIDTF